MRGWCKGRTEVLVRVRFESCLRVRGGGGRAGLRVRHGVVG